MLATTKKLLRADDSYRAELREYEQNKRMRDSKHVMMPAAFNDFERSLGGLAGDLLVDLQWVDELGQAPEVGYHPEVKIEPKCPEPKVTKPNQAMYAQAMAQKKEEEAQKTEAKMQRIASAYRKAAIMAINPIIDNPLAGVCRIASKDGKHVNDQLPYPFG